jgi:hypothetical protein
VARSALLRLSLLSPLRCFFKKRIIIHYNAPKFSYKIPPSFIFLKSYKIISKRGVSPYGFGGDSRPPLGGDSPLGVAVFTTPIKWQKIKKILRN